MKCRLKELTILLTHRIQWFITQQGMKICVILDIFSCKYLHTIVACIHLCLFIIFLQEDDVAYVQKSCVSVLGTPCMIMHSDSIPVIGIWFKGTEHN